MRFHGWGLFRSDKIPIFIVVSFAFQKQRINVEERLLGVETVSSFPRIQEIVEAKEPYDKLWRSVVKFTVRQDEWLNGCLVDLNAEEIEEEV